MSQQHNHISASFGDRKPPYRNWHYNSLRYESGDGHVTDTASWDVGLRSADKWDEVGKSQVGKPVGFGPHAGEVITGYQVLQASYRPHPGGLRVRLKTDANLLLAGKLSQGRPPSGGFTSEEHDSINWLRANAGRSFDVVHPDDIPQMSGDQFFNTMPDGEEAPAGYYLPRGLCEIISGEEASGEEESRGD